MNIFNVISNLPLVTDFPSRKHWEAAVWEILVDRLAKIQSETELRKIMQFLTSSREKHEIIYRALTASRLYTGIGSSEIGRELWVSRATISAVKKSLEEGEYKSSHARGHVKTKNKYYGTPKKDPMIQYKTTKYGKLRKF